MDVITIVIVTTLFGVFFLVNKAVAGSIISWLDSESSLEKVPAIKDSDFTNKTADFRNWVESRGFAPDLCFHSHSIEGDQPILSASWWSEKDKTWALVYYLKGKTYYDFVTKYKKNISVTTGSTKDSIMFPNVPVAYIQAFTRLSFPKLYKKHLEARRKVERKHSISSPELKQDLLPEIIQFQIKHANHIMSLPLWKYRGAYWFFFEGFLRLINPSHEVFLTRLSSRSLPVGPS